MELLEIVSGDELTKEEWGYWYDDREQKLMFCEYTRYERSSKRHHFRAVAVYSTMYTRNNNIEKPYIPNVVKLQILERYRSKITIE
jgi:hypothetical protein